MRVSEMISKTDPNFSFIDLPELHVKRMKLTNITWTDWQGFVHRGVYKIALDNGQKFLLGEEEIGYLEYLKEQTDLNNPKMPIWQAFGTTAHAMKRLQALQKKGLVKILIDYGPRHGKGVMLTPLGYMAAKAIKTYQEAKKQ